MTRHTVTKSEMQAQKIEHLLVASNGKRLLFTYDIGRKRLEYMVVIGRVVYAFDALDEAIEAYNEA